MGTRVEKPGPSQYAAFSGQARGFALFWCKSSSMPNTVELLHQKNSKLARLSRNAPCLRLSGAGSWRARLLFSDLF